MAATLAEEEAVEAAADGQTTEASATAITVVNLVTEMTTTVDGTQMTIIDPSIYKEDEEFGRNSDINSVELIIDGTATPHPSNLPDGHLTTLWPQEVKCEMNTTKWRDALTAANLLPQFDDVLNSFINSFHQGIPDHGVGVLR
ncbi:hypothetical protein PCANC_10593 [Puccinia coronata f. sp. avenae]|uniref:Uncharacterized protein n=1 Tax=Puccinia coronata f. sp. avenae TaxID=200324 RepID=A0A2N5VR84_9BASI|nr:hypothetical protein PCANC_10593 [Puccinia coronata f. sp. avenae]